MYGKNAMTLLAATSIGVLSSHGLAQISFDVLVTADNQYGLYTGTHTSANDYVGGAFNTTAAAIFSPESYSMTLPDNGYIYITAWSDTRVLQGLMARFDSSMGTFYAGQPMPSGQPAWEVTATGLSRANGAPPVSLSDLSEQIQLANAGLNPAGGWVTPHFGPLNTHAATSGMWGGSSGGQVGGGMGPDANWTWYDSGLDPSPNAPYVNGFDHHEYLIFRLPVNVPSPAAAVSLGLFGLVGARRRR